MTETVALLPIAILDASFVSLPKIFGMLVVVSLWLFAAPWVHKDSKLVRAPQNLWSWLVLCVGTGALFLWLVLSVYLVGLLLFVVSVSVILLAYLNYRNGRVSEDEKVRISSLLKGKKHLSL